MLIIIINPILILCDMNCVCFLLFNFKQYKKVDVDKKKEELDRLKAKYGLNTPKVNK